MKLLHLATGPLDVNCYIVGSETTGNAVAIDPGGNAEDILAALVEKELTLKWIINTHGHFDHIGGNRALVDATGAELMIHANDQPLLAGASEHAATFGLTTDDSPQPSRNLRDGEVLKLDDMEFKVIHTPGHSPGGICLLIDSILFVGDTLFAGSIGRTDLPGGDYNELIGNIKQKLLVLPEDTSVCPGHGPTSTIGHEKSNNPFLS